MKNTGVIRKIDELGRIVIPKEIRKNLNIHNGEDVQIFIEEDKIVLQKYQKISSIKDKVNKYINKLSRFYKCQIFVTDREMIIASTNNEKLGVKIDSKIFTLIDERKQYSGNDLNLSDKLLNYYLLPLIDESNAIGSIILSSERNIDENDKNFAEMLNILFITDMN